MGERENIKEKIKIPQIQFLSDPGPIIVYPCQWLTHYWLTNKLVENWMSSPKYIDYAYYPDYPDYADSADFTDYADYVHFTD